MWIQIYERITDMSRIDDIGLVHIYCGDGKGKTTAAVGLAVRCAGGGGKVMFCQFLKGSSSGERAALNKIDGINIVPVPDQIKFVWNMSDSEKEQTRAYYSDKFEAICEAVSDYDMLILDEIIPALRYDFVSIERLIRFLKEKPAGLEVILTGREPDERLLELADYVTEMRKLKHPYDKGISMRNYIEI